MGGWVQCVVHVCVTVPVRESFCPEEPLSPMRAAAGGAPPGFRSRLVGRSWRP